MKKTFLARRNALLSSTTGLSWGLVVLGCVLFLVLMRFLAPNFFLHIAAPLFATSHAVTAHVRAWGDGFKNAVMLAEKNTQLVYENQALAFENQTLIARLHDLGKLTDASLSGGIIAGVLMRPPESSYDTLVLSSGEEDGVVLDMKVFGPGGVPIGIVSHVSADFSRVTLFSASGVVTHGWIGLERVPLEMRGVGGGAVEAVMPRALTVVPDDLVFVPGPGAIPYGKVIRIADEPSSPQVTLRIMPVTNLFSLTWVTVQEYAL